jgi:ketopantoate reductase
MQAGPDDGPWPARPTPSSVRGPSGCCAVWSKFCVSCAINGLAVVAGEGVGPITRTRPGREALVGVLSEVTRLAEAEGVALERVAGPLGPDRLAGDPSHGPGAVLRRAAVWLIGRRYRDVRPSSIRALAGGRDPELDPLNAEAVRRGEATEVPTPWNEATLALAREVVAGKREPSLANLAAVGKRAQADA